MINVQEGLRNNKSIESELNYHMTCVVNNYRQILYYSWGRRYLFGKLTGGKGGCILPLILLHCMNNNNNSEMDANLFGA